MSAGADADAPDVSGFFDVARRQRACRDFSDRPVPDDVVERMLEAATYAPSAENAQPWVFVVVRDDATRASIMDLTERAWAGGGRAFAERRLTPGLLADVDHGVVGGGFRAAPVLVVVGADLAALPRADRRVVDLPRHAEPVARRGRARARLRARRR